MGTIVPDIISLGLQIVVRWTALPRWKEVRTPGSGRC